MDAPGGLARRAGRWRPVSRGLSDREIDRARRDPVVFAELVLREPLWEHQRAVVTSPARYRVLNAGRRSGKTRTFGVLALHRMYSVPGTRVLMVSSGRTAVTRSHREIAAMAKGSIGGDSVEDDQVMTLRLSNDSLLESVTQSQNAVRSADVDLLIIDEAGWVEQLVWESAEPTIGARPGARVLIASTPNRGPGHFFHDLWRQGMQRPDGEVESWHWPTTINPNVDLAWLEGVRQRSAPDYFSREYEAEWSATAGAYFTSDEIDGAIADHELLSPDVVRADDRERVWWPAVGGVDWGLRQDANALVMLAPLEDEGRNEERLGVGGRALYVPWLEAHYRMPYEAFIGRLVDAARAYELQVLVSEMNGPGDMPTTSLRSRLHEARLTPPWVAPVWTTARRKQTAFGTIKMLLQARRLVLPRHPELLAQLRGLEFEQTDVGNLRISVPERIGHDDLVMAFAQAVSCLRPDGLRGREVELGVRAGGDGPVAEVGSGAVTAGGVWVPRRPRPAADMPSWSWFKLPPKAADSETPW